MTRYVKGNAITEWVKGKSERNEALDLMVYCLAMAHYLGLDRYKERDWDRVAQALAQAELFAEKVPATATAVDQPVIAAESVIDSPAPEPAAPQVQAQPIARPPQRRSSSSGYLKRR